MNQSIRAAQIGLHLRNLSLESRDYLLLRLYFKHRLLELLLHLRYFLFLGPDHFERLSVLVDRTAPLGQTASRLRRVSNLCLVPLQVLVTKDILDPGQDRLRNILLVVVLELL